MKLANARKNVEELAALLRPYCERLEIGGSIRRARSDVKDGELIAIPTPDLLSFTDHLVQEYVVTKALYGETQTTRWGDKYRGMQFGDMKVELFLADAQSWGYIWWLRTGPGEANEYIMRFLSYKNAPIRFQDGYPWYSAKGWTRDDKQKWVASDRIKLMAESEHDLFKLLGMPFIPPERRSEEGYKMLLGDNPEHRWPDFTKFYAPKPKAAHSTLSFLEPDPPDEEENAEDASARKLEAERDYNRGVMARHQDIFNRAANGKTLEHWEQRIVNNRKEIEGGSDWLNIADGLWLKPADFIGKHVAVLGMTGMGKSNSIAVLIEELARFVQMTIIDLEGEYHSLREIHPFLVVGHGEDVDRDVSVAGAEALCEEIMASGQSVILDLYEFDEDERNEFLRRYLDRLFQIEGRLHKPHIVVMEEAHEFLNQRKKSEVTDSAIRIAKRGRKRGIGMVFATQRAAAFDKEALTSCLTLILHRVQYAQDIGQYKGMLPKAFPTEATAINLEVGAAIVRRRGLDGKPREDVFHIRRRKTTDLGATPVLEQAEAVIADVPDVQMEMRIKRLEKA